MTQTKITQQDLKVFLSENIRDTEDGGGLRTGNYLTGVDNELFDPIGDQSNALGNLSMRLVYAGVDRPDAEPLLEGGFIIAEPPKNPNVSFLAFMAAYNGELRKDAVKRLEAYSIKTINSRITLLSNQTQGSRLIMGYQMPKEPDPKVGEVYCLDQDTTGHPKQEEYVKIRKITTENREFYNQSTNKYFTRKIVKLEITEPLRANYTGAEAVKEGYQKPPCLLRETMVADAGKYYGVKPLAHNISSGDTVIRVPSVFDKIIPSSQIASPLTDLEAGSQVTSLLDGGAFRLSGIFSKSGQTIQTGHALMPKSIYLQNTFGHSQTVYDDGEGIIIDKENSRKVAEIDYQTGAVKLFWGGGNLYHVIGGKRAIKPRQIADTAAISIDQTNQSLVYMITLDPPPLKGSAMVSYRSQGRWYDLIDDGSGTMKGIDPGHGSGAIDAVTHTVSVSLGALPDVGSSVIFSWATPVSYFNRSNVAVAAPEFITQLEHNTIAPNTVTVKYLDNSNVQKTATDNGSGVITGTNFSAKIDYAQGKVTFTYSQLPKGGASYEFAYSYGNPLTKAFPSPNRNADGTISLNLAQTNIKPRTVKMIWNVDIQTFDYISTTPAEMQVHGKTDPYITVFDDGAGNLKDAAGKSYGTINYATGIISFSPDTTVKIPVGRYKVTHIGYDKEQPRLAGFGGITNVGKKVYRNQFSHWEYVDAGVSMPLGPTGKVDVWFNAGNASNNHTMTKAIDGLTIDLTPLYAEPIVASSVVFTMGGKTYTDNNGSLYYNHNMDTGASAEAGTINYADGKSKITAWTPGQSPNVGLISLLTALDKNPVDEVVFCVPQAPIQPQSLQLRATTLQGNPINVTADADGNLSGANIVGRVEVADGVVRCRFGQWVTAAGNEGQLWYKAEAVVGTKIFKPLPVYADSIKYNAVAYTYLPLNSTAIGVDTVRFPSDGRVPIYRAGDMIVVAARYKQDLGTAFTAGQVVQMNVTNLTSLCVIDAKRKHVTADKYTTDLQAGKVTFASPLDLSDFDLPLTASYSVEETATVSQVDISGSLTLVSPLQKNYDKTHTFVSSVMVGGKMQVRATKPFSQTTWTNVWSDERIGDAVLTQLDTKNYPVILTDDGAITDRWVIVFEGGLKISLYSESMGHIITTDWLADLSPVNPASNKPYFVIKKQAFGPTDNPKWSAGRCVRFNTFGAVLMPWIVRATQPNTYTQTGRDGAVLCLRGNTVALTT